MPRFEPAAYGDVFRVKEAYRFDIGGLLMRTYAFMRTIGSISMLTLAGYSFFVAGTISSLIAVSMFLISPLISRRVDHVGQRAVVPGATAIALVGLALMLATVYFGWSFWLCYPAAVLMGFLPTAQALTRARWTYLIRSGRLGDNAPDLKTVFSYEGIIDDIAFMVGPALAVALSAALSPIAGMLAGSLFCIGGTALLLSSGDTEPRVGWGVGEEEPTKQRKSLFSRGGQTVLATSPVVRILFFLMLFLGVFYGVFDTATIAFAEDVGQPTVASGVLVVEALVSVVSGFLFGMFRFSVKNSTQLVATAVLIGCAYASMALIDSIEALYLVAGLASIFYAPFVITANEACERAVPGSHLTEAITWINSGSICGVAAGPTLGGMIIESYGTVASFDMGALFAIALAVVAVAFRSVFARRMR